MKGKREKESEFDKTRKRAQYERKKERKKERKIIRVQMLLT